jgi:hypothetical protein
MKVAIPALSVAFVVASLGIARAAEIGPPAEPRPETPEQARCKALGEGFFAVRGSTSCIRISGYVSAGTGFVEPGRIAAPTTGPFASRGFAYSTEDTGVAVESRFDTELGPGRIYVEVGGAKVNR